MKFSGDSCAIGKKWLTFETDAGRILDEGSK